MSLRVVRPGSLSTVQDLGRHGLQHLGIVPGGAMDPIAHQLANALVGNPSAAATLECTVLGPSVVVECDLLVALYGAMCDAKAGGLPLPRNRPVLLKAGTRMTIGAATHGARAYLAVAGGIQVPEVLGSRSTYIPAAFGGLSGRALRADDRLPCSSDAEALSAARFERVVHGRAETPCDAWRSVRWFAPDLTLPPSDGAQSVRAMAGRHYDQFDADSQAAFFDHDWRVAPDSNRMGFRLQAVVPAQVSLVVPAKAGTQGPVVPAQSCPRVPLSGTGTQSRPPLTRTNPTDILSEPTCLGTVQVPNDGSPIALMADHQTTGGYPKIAEIASADIPVLAQLAPGGRVRFVRCSLEEAAAARIAAEARVTAVLQAIESMFT